VNKQEYLDDYNSSNEETINSLFSIRNLPERYKIKEHDGKRILICLEVPNIGVLIEPGLTVSSSAARKAPPCTIYLDGVAQSEPFMDLEKQIYNFDHHEGCIRPFTLSTCEQVLVMILKGMDLRGRDWRVFANEPDLDTILAIWLIFNHVRVQQKEFGGLDRLCALVRLEGVIDSHGLEMAALSGFAPKSLAKTKKLIEYLRAEEVDLKSKGIWRENDVLEYAALILHKVDRIIYKSAELSDVKDVKELARVEFGDNRIAVAVETQLGIYELESYLDRLYGERLGLVILKKDEGTYTLRSWDPFIPGGLNAVYKILNFIDPAVRGRTEGNKWGGSADIGGSPRGDGGTKLTPQQIVKACRDAFEKPSLGGYVIRFIHSLAITFAIIALSTVCTKLPFFRSWFSIMSTGAVFTDTYITFFATVLFFTLVFLGLYAYKRPWQFGLALPSGKNWWIMGPFVFLSVIGMGIFLPYKGIISIGNLLTIVYLVVIIPLSLELLFRSLAHGILIKPYNVRSNDKHLYLSFPSIASATLFAASMVGIMLYPDYLQNGFQAKAAIVCLFAALVIGLFTAFVREQSQSVLPSVLFHALGMGGLVCYYSFAIFTKM
jgi:hypothetical protein